MRKLIIIMVLTAIGNSLVGSMQQPIKESTPPELPQVRKVVVREFKKPSQKPYKAIVATFKAKVVAEPKPVQNYGGGNIEQIVRQAARKYGLDEEYFVSIARCESGLTPTSVNYNYFAGGGNPSGLFQFLPETWNRMSSQSGIGGDVFNPVANANVAAWAWANGHSGEWECQ